MFTLMSSGVYIVAGWLRFKLTSLSDINPVICLVSSTLDETSLPGPLLSAFAVLTKGNKTSSSFLRSQIGCFFYEFSQEDRKISIDQKTVNGLMTTPQM
jgi:hypothetical protein